MNCEENFTIHIFGYSDFTLHFAQKESDINKKKEIKLFCDFLSKEVDLSKITTMKKKVWANYVTLYQNRNGLIHI
jgi:hypothetical protein